MNPLLLYASDVSCVTDVIVKMFFYITDSDAAYHNQIKSTDYLNKIGKWAQLQLALYYLRKISLIHKYLNFDAVQPLAHALLTLKFYYCNSLLYGLPKHVIKQLQRVQNAAARVVTVSPKFFHVSPVLANLHRIFIGFRLNYEMNLQYLPSPTRLSMVWFLVLLKIFFKDTIRHDILGLQRKKLLAFTVVAALLWNSLFHAGSGFIANEA